MNEGNVDCLHERSKRASEKRKGSNGVVEENKWGRLSVDCSVNSIFWGGRGSTVGEQGKENDESFYTEAQEMGYEEATMVTRSRRSQTLNSLNSQVSSITKCHTTVEAHACEFTNLRHSQSSESAYCLLYCL